MAHDAQNIMVVLSSPSGVGKTTITKKIVALIGSITFILYLIYDFNRLKQLSEYGVNDWYTAFQIGYSIYLDVLNLLLYLLELLG